MIAFAECIQAEESEPVTSVDYAGPRSGYGSWATRRLLAR